MPTKTLCPVCHGQRTTSCSACRGSGKRSFAGVTVGTCKQCNGRGQRRCQRCGGLGEVEPENNNAKRSAENAPNRKR